MRESHEKLLDDRAMKIDQNFHQSTKQIAWSGRISKPSLVEKIIEEKNVKVFFFIECFRVAAISSDNIQNFD